MEQPEPVHGGVPIGGRARGWVFTLNNYTDADQQRLRDAIDGNTISYLVFGREVGEHGTPHLQGFIYLRTARAFNTVRALLGSERIHLERMRGTPKQASDYCKKDGDYEEFGELPAQGKRTDLDRFMEDVRDHGIRDKRQLLEAHVSVHAKYPRFVEAVLETYRPRPQVPDIELRDWQQLIVDELHLAAHPRRIVFIVDQAGNGGKSTFAKYLAAVFDRVQILRPGKLADMARVIQVETRIVIMDVPRESQEVIQYSFLESLKDGLVWSPKYESSIKYMDAIPHVLVFCNAFPDMQKLSADRYVVRVLQ